MKKVDGSVEHLKERIRLLECENQQLKSLINQLPGDIYWKDLNGVWRGVNDKGMESLTRMNVASSKDDVIGKTDYELFTKKTADTFRSNDLEVIKTKKTVSNEEKNNLADGTVIEQLSVKSPLLDAKGDVIGIMGNTIDITQLKTVENELKKAKEKAEASSYIMTEFVSNMGHMLVTPFSSISGMASILMYGYGDKYLELKPMFEELLKGCTAWEKVYQEIIRATSISEIEVKPERFSLSQELQNIVDILKPSAAVKKLKLSFKSSKKHEDDSIETDKLKFHLIVIELISNAIKFTDQGRVVVSISQEKDLYMVQVTDTGVGIPIDKIDFIFEQYTMLSRANKYGANFQGVGAGLFLAKQRAKLIDAKIQVKSIEGKGATFTLIIPRIYGSNP